MDIAPGRKALITGGASGFGREIARRLSAEGATIAILDIDRERAAATAAELPGAGHLGVQADVRSLEQTAEAVATAAAGLGGIDTVVVSAGVFTMGPIEEISEADWDRTIGINLKGAFTTLRATRSLKSRPARARSP